MCSTFRAPCKMAHGIKAFIVLRCEETGRRLIIPFHNCDRLDDTSSIRLVMEGCVVCLCKSLGRKWNVPFIIWYYDVHTIIDLFRTGTFSYIWINDMTNKINASLNAEIRQTSITKCSIKIVIYLCWCTSFIIRNIMHKISSSTKVNFAFFKWNTIFYSSVGTW